MKKVHKILFSISFVLLIISWVISLIYWGKLPSIIPTHFGFNGMPDAWNKKSILYTFLLPSVQALMFFIFLFLYYKPQYSNMPTTLWLTTLDKDKKEHAFNLIRIMHATILIWINLLLTYMVYEMNESALSQKGLNPLIMLTMLVIMLIFIVAWNIKIYKSTKEAMRK